MHPSPPLANAPLTAMVAPVGLKEGFGAREVTDHSAGRVTDSTPPARLRTAHSFDGGERCKQAPNCWPGRTDAFLSIVDGCPALRQAMADTKALMHRAADDAIHLVAVGLRSAERVVQAAPRLARLC